LSSHGSDQARARCTPFLAALLVPCLLGCGVAGVQVTEDAAVYAALLEEQYPGGVPPVVIVTDAAIVMPALTGSSPGWQQDADAIPVELRRAAERQSGALTRFDATMFPRQVQLVPYGSVRALFDQGTEEGWSAFRQAFHVGHWLAFSSVLTTGDGRDALVYYEQRCGGLCGDGAFVWLQRKARRTPWVIRSRIITWVS
jgi:hypothetical protein